MNLKNAPVLAFLVASASAVSAEQVASKCKMEVTKARGALRSLRNAGYAGGDNQEATATTRGKKALEQFQAVDKTGGDIKAIITTPTGRTHNRRTKMAKATTLFQQHIGKGRQAVLAQFKSKLEMTDGGAATYYQNIKKAVESATAS